MVVAKSEGWGEGETTKELHEGDFWKTGVVLCHDSEGDYTYLCLY